MRKLILVYNPSSSHYGGVEEAVLAPARQLKGWMVGKYAVKPTNFDDNVQSLARLMEDGDLVVVAGGDGTASMAINGIMRSGKQVVLGVLGFGNFNDIAGMLGERNLEGIISGYERGVLSEVYPLEVVVDGELWRYALGYFTIGMFAESTEIFDSPKVRRKLQGGKKSRLFSIWQLAKWYFRKGKRNRLSAGALNGENWTVRATDYIALNSKTMAGVMRGGEWFLNGDEFLSTVQELGSFHRLVKFMLRSMRERVPGVVSKGDVLKFAEPSAVELHAEGEHEKRDKVSEIVVRKANKALRVAILRYENRGGRCGGWS